MKENYMQMLILKLMIFNLREEVICLQLMIVMMSSIEKEIRKTRREVEKMNIILRSMLKMTKKQMV
jgi:hypothetical protein